MRYQTSLVFNYYDEQTDKDCALEVVYDYYGGSWGTYYEPPDPPTVEIISIKNSGVEVEVSEALKETILEACFENEDDADGNWEYDED